MKNRKSYWNEIGVKIVFLILITLGLFSTGKLNASNPGTSESSNTAISINITNIRSHSFRATWSAVPEVESYKIHVVNFWTSGSWTNFPVETKGPGITSMDVDFSGYYIDGDHSHKFGFWIQALDKSSVEIARAASADFWLPWDAPWVKSITNISTSSFTIQWHQPSTTDGVSLAADTQITISKKNGAMWQAISGYPKTVKKPVDSTTTSMFNSAQGRFSGNFSEITFILCPLIINKPSSAVIVPGKGPCTESYLKRCAKVWLSVRSFMATTFNSFSLRVIMFLKVFLPILPKPLIAIFIFFLFYSMQS